MNIFLAVPFSSYVEADGSVEADYRASMEHVLQTLRGVGHTVYCALEYANWQYGGMSSPEDELRHDFAMINESDRVVVLLEERVSAGVQLENGYAFANKKEILCYQIGKAAWSNVAFARLNGHEIQAVKDIPDFVAKVIASN